MPALRRAPAPRAAPAARSRSRPWSSDAIDERAPRPARAAVRPGSRSNRARRRPVRTRSRSTPARRQARAAGRTGRIPLEIEGDRRRVAVGPSERLVGVVDRRRVGLVADRPLPHRIVAGVLGPQRFALHDERVGPHRHLEVGDVQQRSARPRERRPVPRGPTDDPMSRDHAEFGVCGPGGEHPFLDRSVGMAPLGGTGIGDGLHDQADYGP